MTDKKDTSKSETSSASSGSVSKEEKELSAQSNAAYQKNEYKKCLSFLKKLTNKRPDDPKVLHNYGLVEFYQSGCKHTDKFKEIFERIDKMINSDSKNDHKMDDVDQCVIYLNQAVLFYHLHLYSAAIDILDNIFVFIEPLDSSLARQVCFLLIDLYLCTCQPEKALGLINYVEKTLFSGSDSGSKKSDNNKDLKDKSNGQQVLKTGQDFTAFKPKLMQFKVKSYIMLKSMKACRREAKSLMASGNNVHAVYLKANTEYLRNNFKKAMRLLTNCPLEQADKFAETGENMIVYYNNNLGCMNLYSAKPYLAQVYFNKAFQELSKQYSSLMKPSDQGNGKNFPLVVRSGDMQHQIYYNLGLSLLFSDKPEAAFKYLVKASKVYRKNPRLWLRIAECCIRIHKLSNECDFKTADRKVDMVHNVIGAGPHRKLILSSNVSKYDKPKNENNTKTVEGPNLRYANLCLNTALILLSQYNNFQANSHHNTKSNENVEQDKGASSLNQSNANFNTPEASFQYIPALPANPIYGAEIASLRVSILSASAYVNLLLENPSVSLAQAKELLSLPKLAPRNKYLAHMYAAEALIKLNQTADALSHLNIDQYPADLNIISADTIEKVDNADSQSDSNANAQAHKESDKLTNSFKSWYPNTCATARNAMKYNQTVANTLLGHYEVASVDLKRIADTQGPDSEMPVQAMTLAMYLQLRLGHADLTRNMIRQNCPQYRF